MDQNWNATSTVDNSNIYIHDNLDARQVIDEFRVKFNNHLEHETKMKDDPDYAAEYYLKHHDWYYVYSDDHRVYKSGWTIEGKIRENLMKLPLVRREELWKKYAPPEFSM